VDLIWDSGDEYPHFDTEDEEECRVRRGGNQRGVLAKPLRGMGLNAHYIRGSCKGDMYAEDTRSPHRQQYRGY
jgi:hypothetical protein